MRERAHFYISILEHEPEQAQDFFSDEQVIDVDQLEKFVSGQRDELIKADGDLSIELTYLSTSQSIAS